MMEGPDKLAAGVVLWRGRAQAPEFLLLRNARHGSWGFVKGHLEAGEAPLAGALRECREETGVRLQESDLVKDFADASHYVLPQGKLKRVVMFLCARALSEADLRRSTEHDAHEWLPSAKALTQVAHEELRRTLVRATVRLAQAEK
jgi:8-oxo-dGTP pyrophosphatase MutT (NUDIX family)